MSALHDVQSQFFDFIFNGSEDFSSLLKMDALLPAERRMNIYKNNTLYILTDALMEIFSATATLASPEFFRFLSAAFINEHPPRSGDVTDYGAELSAFMHQFSALQNYPFLVDVAALEWLRHEAFHASDTSTTSLHTSLRLLSSPYPIMQLWQAGHALKDAATLDMNQGENIVLFRQDDGVEMWSIPADDFAFISALHTGDMPDIATAKAKEINAAFDSKDVLSHLLSAGIIT